MFNTYTEDTINAFKIKCRNKETLHYEDTDQYLYSALKKYKLGQKTLVIGSQEPCYEALAFLYGAQEVITVEYKKIISTYKNLKCITTTEFEQDTVLYDSALSISSVEHSGLGRYGDPIDDNGDLKAMALLKTKMKVGGICFLAVPIGDDRIEGNLHRVYGKMRLPKLLDGWTIIDKIGFNDNIFHSSTLRNQPVLVIKND